MTRAELPMIFEHAVQNTVILDGARVRVARIVSHWNVTLDNSLEFVRQLSDKYHWMETCQRSLNWQNQKTKNGTYLWTPMLDVLFPDILSEPTSSTFYFNSSIQHSCHISIGSMNFFMRRKCLLVKPCLRSGRTNSSIY